MKHHISRRNPMSLPVAGRRTRTAASSRRIAVLVLAAGAWLGPACADPEPAPSQTLDVTDQPEQTITAAALAPGDTVVDHGVSAVVPDRGEGVQGVGELAGGGAVTIAVETALDGAVTIMLYPEPVVSADAATVPTRRKTGTAVRAPRGIRRTRASPAAWSPTTSATTTRINAASTSRRSVGRS